MSLMANTFDQAPEGLILHSKTVKKDSLNMIDFGQNFSMSITRLPRIHRLISNKSGDGFTKCGKGSRDICGSRRQDKLVMS
ncbi:hypothetical protein F511_46786 [Dorcoceras hygrometricum]|uniref:Uncharacterized protein n=1 Tax=Dorcoceras hygrometricum TaxID=472368 RepID=A0A2Z6ZT79_9LAMI|nr:hypothetical protein F511_46786 [Dorcoceras hygrometricum]